jgi:hypothetical protein
MSDDTKFLSSYKFAIWDKASSIQPTIRDVKANGGECIDMKRLVEIYQKTNEDHHHNDNDNDNNNHTFIIVSSDSYPHLPDDVKDRYSDIIVTIQWLGICLHRRKVIPYNPFLLSNQTRLVLRSADKRMKNNKRQTVHPHNNSQFSIIMYCFLILIFYHSIIHLSICEFINQIIHHINHTIVQIDSFHYMKLS